MLSCPPNVNRCSHYAVYKCMTCILRNFTLFVVVGRTLCNREIRWLVNKTGKLKSWIKNEHEKQFNDCRLQHVPKVEVVIVSKTDPIELCWCIVLSDLRPVMLVTSPASLACRHLDNMLLPRFCARQGLRMLSVTASLPVLCTRTIDLSCFWYINSLHVRIICFRYNFFFASLHPQQGTNGEHFVGKGYECAFYLPGSHARSFQCSVD